MNCVYITWSTFLMRIFLRNSRPQGVRVIMPKWLPGCTSDCGDSVIISLMQWWRKAWKAVPHELCRMWPFCLLPIRRGSGACPFYICCWWSTEFSCSWDKSTCIYLPPLKCPFDIFSMFLFSRLNNRENCRMLLYPLASHNWKVDLSK
jgi:hypothetical protein